STDATETVILRVAAANRDPTQFSDPDRFDIHRTPNPHLAFGHGIHFCLGAPLARLEAKIALGILLGRYREIAVARDEPAECYNPWTMISAKRLPVHVQPDGEGCDVRSFPQNLSEVQREAAALSSTLLFLATDLSGHSGSLRSRRCCRGSTDRCWHSPRRLRRSWR